MAVPAAAGSDGGLPWWMLVWIGLAVAALVMTWRHLGSWEGGKKQESRDE